MKDTIVALATPAGRSGIGVIRLSGNDALKLTGELLNGDLDLKPRHAHLKNIHDKNTGEIIDQAVVTYYKTPNSFTGEDVIEVACHGSPVIIRQLIEIYLALGARLAEPGEFTLRALSNGQMDLTEAEAIRDLIDARTTAAARQAVKQLSGEFSHRLQPLKDRLLNVIVILESSLEFVEDDLPAAQTSKIIDDLADIQSEVKKMAQTFDVGHILRDGLRIALIGKPNVGKSSIFNSLVGHDRAIVTDIAGTTRDQINETFTINDIPVSLIDTAGLRETDDTVESIGVERSRRTMADADMVVVVLDASQQIDKDDQEIIDGLRDLRHIIVSNKIDLTSEMPLQNTIAVSAKTGQGLDDLKAAISKPFKIEDASTDGFLITDARHHDLLNRSADDIGDSIEHLKIGTSEEITLIGLHNALRYLGEITGETTTEDMLTRIFSTFCIGK